ncbi:hypothetical protein CEXT_80671 [Caerostris extrusa]|uniref:Uncharacterized protein n=1 Tax=Caerostris extrusa TaxID=172846 RepID=A0AAV4QFU2_CAEEX|nr:hypothetical protein CEXT_80671 [Caerostris extrusa]
MPACLFVVNEQLISKLRAVDLKFAKQVQIAISVFAIAEYDIRKSRNFSVCFKEGSRRCCKSPNMTPLEFVPNCGVSYKSDVKIWYSVVDSYKSDAKIWYSVVDSYKSDAKVWYSVVDSYKSDAKVCVVDSYKIDAKVWYSAVDYYKSDAKIWYSIVDFYSDAKIWYSVVDSYKSGAKLWIRCCRLLQEWEV